MENPIFVTGEYLVCMYVTSIVMWCDEWGLEYMSDDEVFKWKRKRVRYGIRYDWRDQVLHFHHALVWRRKRQCQRVTHFILTTCLNLSRNIRLKSLHCKQNLQPTSFQKYILLLVVYKNNPRHLNLSANYHLTIEVFFYLCWTIFVYHGIL